MAVLAETKQRSERLNRAPTGEETGLAVALFGTAVLAGSGLDGFHRLRAQSSDSGSSGSSDSGGSGGGGGGMWRCGGAERGDLPMACRSATAPS